MIVTPIDAYATTDGKLFMDMMEAQAHQYGLDIKPQIEEFLGDGYVYCLNGFTKLSAILDWETTRKLQQLKGELV